MSDQDDAASKEFDPTPRKLEQARRKGDIPKSTDLNVAGAYLGLVVAITVAGTWMAQRFGSLMSAVLARAAQTAETFSAGGSGELSKMLIGGTVFSVAPLLIIPALVVLAGLTAQRGIVFAPSKLMPKASRISPIENAKNKFGPNGLFEFLKSATKLSVFSVCLGLYLLANLDEIVTAALLSANAVAAELGRRTTEFLLIVFVIALLIGCVDLLWQISEHRRRNRMSRKELQDESKESEGDPHLKQERRQRGQAIATSRMMADVPGADVVIVNPTHFAVALSWDRSDARAPVCVAKGADHLAARIREVAAEAGVPVYSDPPTARSLFAFVEIGQEIRPQDYRAVAVAIRFAEDMARRARWPTAKS